MFVIVIEELGSQPYPSSGWRSRLGLGTVVVVVEVVVDVVGQVVVVVVDVVVEVVDVVGQVVVVVQ